MAGKKKQKKGKKAMVLARRIKRNYPGATWGSCLRGAWGHIKKAD